MAIVDTDKMDTFEKIGYTFNLIKPSWQAFRLNWLTFVLIWIIPVVIIIAILPFIIMAISIDNNIISITSSIIAGLLIFAGLLVSLALLPTAIYAQLESVKGIKINFKDSYAKAKKHTLNFVIAFLLSILIIFGPLAISFLLMIVLIGFAIAPFAFIWIFVAGFYLYLVQFIIVDKNTKAIEAIKQSYYLTRSKWDWVISLLAVSFLVNLATSALSTIAVVGWAVAGALTIAYYCTPANIYVNKIAYSEPKLSASQKNTKKANKKTKLKD